MTRPSMDEILMEMAVMVSRRSTCIRMAVGCVLSDFRRERIAFGYNGTARGLPNICRFSDHAPGGCGCAHAEQNALVKAGRGMGRAYVTMSPCPVCAVLLVNAGIRAVTYRDLYRDLRGLDILRDAGVTLHHMRDGDAE